VAIPDRLEEFVGKANGHDALDRLLAEEMVDPIDLLLVQNLQNPRVQSFGGFEAVPERLLDDDVPPALATLLIDKSCSRDLVDHRPEEAVGNGQIEQNVAARMAFVLRLLQQLTELLEGGIVGEIAAQIAHFVEERSPGVVVDRLWLKLAAARKKALHHAVEIVAPL